MTAAHRGDVAKKACIRCRHQKRRCDRAIPECGLCSRLHQACRYEVRQVSSSDPALSSPSSRTDSLLGLETLGPNNVRDAIIERLGQITPDDVVSEYTKSLHPWFPIIPHAFQGQLLSSWNEASLDFTILALCIIMLTCAPPSASQEENPSTFKSLYIYAKSWISLIEGFGINSIEVVQARICMALFEAAHGFYPAASISIGAASRAADAINVYPISHMTPFRSSDDAAKRKDAAFLWCAIHILDRYIAVESEPRVSFSRWPTNDFHEALKEELYPALLEEDLTGPVCQISRLLEASTLLDKLHVIVKGSTAEHIFKLDEIMLLLDASNNLRTILLGEAEDGHEGYSGALALCNIGLLLLYENGTKVPTADEVTSTCNSIATLSLNSLLTTVTNTIEPFVVGTQALDFNCLPLFIVFSVYKAAALVTNRIATGIETNEGLRRLRILRAFLTMLSARWSCCERYLELLNEDTTPRILKSIHQ